MYWYENADDAEPMKREYFWETNVPATLVDKVKPVASEQDLERPVKKPHIIGPHGKDYSKWHLVVTSYYQEGKNARHYELSLEDENGNPVELSEELAIYLPYPNGFNYGDEETTFALRHYSSDLYSENNPNLHGRQVMVIPTEYGLKFVTSTFSPFIVSWETEEPEAVVPDEPSVPQTGDDTQLGLLFVLMAASALLGTALLRRKTAHK